MPRTRPLSRRLVMGLATALACGAAVPAASGATAPSDDAAPDLVPLLSGYNSLWQSDGKNDLHGRVLAPGVLAANDARTVWINRHATKRQQFRALQNSAYDDDGKGYDQSVSIADGLGSVLGPLYVKGRQGDALPLTSALINSEDGTSGAYVSTSDAKATFSYPRPFLPTDPDAKATPGDEAACAPSTVNGSSLASIRQGRPYTQRDGSLAIKRVPDTVDTTHQFASADVALSAEYGSKGICTGGSFPSGHTTTAYQAGITLATLLPELAPEILARTSEAGNNRIVLGVHYPIDIIGGRIDGESALAARWSDPTYRKTVLEPARRELVRYLTKACGGSITACAARGSSYVDDPYGGRAIPGGSSQVVTDRRSAVKVYTERLDYGLPAVGRAGRGAAVPKGAANLLRTTFPTLSDAQRRSVLAQTQSPSGSVLDRTRSGEGSWQRLNLAAATSATVVRTHHGGVRVIKTGGRAQVVGHGHGHGHGH